MKEHIPIENMEPCRKIKLLLDTLQNHVNMLMVIVIALGASISKNADIQNINFTNIKLSYTVK